MVYTIEYYSAIKRNTFVSVLVRWMNLRICHTEWSKSKREKQVLCINTYIYGTYKNGPLEKEMATHSSILAWKIQWTKEPGGLVRGVTEESDKS